MQLNALLAEIVHAPHGAAPFLAQLHDGPRELGGCQNRRVHDGLAHLGDLALGELARVVDAHLRSVLRNNAVNDVGRRGNQVEVELSFEPLANDLQVQQTQEATPEAEAEGGAGFRFKRQGRVVELEAFEGVAQVGKVRAVNRVDAGEDHRVGVSVASQRLGRAAHLAGHGVANSRLAHVLHARDQVPDLARADTLLGGGFGGDYAQLEQLVGGAR